MFSLINLSTLFVLIGWISAYPDGAPNLEQACLYMNPSNLPPQTGPAPFSFIPDKTEVGPGEEIRFSVSGLGPGATFRGFMIQGRSLFSYTPAGTFLDSYNGVDAHGVDCYGIPKSSITHTNKRDKLAITVVWRAPQTVGTYHLLSTVVVNQQIFWIAQPSTAINVVEVPKAIQSANTTFPTNQTLASPIVANQPEPLTINRPQQLITQQSNGQQLPSRSPINNPLLANSPLQYPQFSSPQFGTSPFGSPQFGNYNPYNYL